MFGFKIKVSVIVFSFELINIYHFGAAFTTYYAVCVSLIVEGHKPDDVYV